MTGLFRLGLTGSIGMGKTTTAAMFRERDIPVWDADGAVHRLYRRGGAAVGPVGHAFPSVIRGGEVDRAALRALVLSDADALKRLEAIVHPLVAADRSRFLAEAQMSGANIAVVDVPLLFETGADKDVDGVAVVSTTAETQRTRVLARPGMTEEAFVAIVGRQMPDAEKRARADWIIDTGTLESARKDVDRILRDIEGRLTEDA